MRPTVSAPAPPPPPARRNLTLRITIATVLVVGLILVLWYRNLIDAAAIARWLEDQPLWQKVLEYLALHVAASLFFVPRLFMGIAAGVMLGSWWGSIFSVVGGTLGAYAGFVLVRFVNSGAVRLREAPAIGAWIARAEAQGWLAVFIVRLIPVLPHSLVNYVFAISRISTAGYLFGSMLGLIPTSIVYAGIGASGRGIAEGTSDYAMLTVWVAGLIFLAWLLPKIAERLFPPRSP